MQRHLLLEMCCLLAVFAVQPAQAATEDVTSQYLTNADFTTDTALTNGVCTYSKDMANNSTTYFGLQAVTGWTANVPTDNQTYTEASSMCARAGGVFAYGNTAWLGGSDYVAPATNPNSGSDGQCLGVIAVWSDTALYTSETVTLPAGSYTITIPVYNAGGTGSITNYTGFYNSVGTALALSSSTTYTEKSWTTDQITFTLSEETEGYFAIGFYSSNGSGSTPHLFFDGMTIDFEEATTDGTDSITNGAYYLKANGEYRYLSQGGWWGTAATYDVIGMPLTATAVSSNVYTFANTERGDGCYIYTTTTNGLDVYTDASTNYNWVVTPTDGGYYISMGAYYLYPYSETVNGYTYTRVGGTTDQSSATVWEFLTETQYQSSLAEARDAQAAAAASSAGIEAASVDELETAIADYYTLDYSSKIVNPDFKTDITTTSDESGWEPVSFFETKTASKFGWLDLSEFASLGIDAGDVNALAYLDESMGMEQTISGLTEGLYKVETYALFCPIALLDVLGGDFDDDDLAPASSAFAYAKTASTTAYNEVKGYEGEPIIDLTTLEVYAEKVLPNYTNANYIYVKNGEDLTIGLSHERHNSNNTVLNWHWTLTYYAAEEYTIGNPTYSIAEGATIDPDDFNGTLTVTFGNAMSIYSAATLKLLDSDAAITLTASDGTAYTGSITSYNTDGYVLTIAFSGATLVLEDTYTVTIPAGVVGFTDENTNDELTLTFYTRCDIEGAGYLKVADSENSYLSRGSNWGTRAITDSYGAPVELAYTEDGTATVHFLDNNGYLFEADGLASTIYTDNSTYPYWTFKAVDGGYAIYDGNSTSSNGQPLCYDSDGNLAVIDGGEAIVWTIESIEDHTAYLQSLSDATAAATAAGLGLTVESKVALSELLADTTLFEASDVTITGKTSSSTSEFYQGTQGSETTVFTETVSGLDAGIYKVSVQAYYRISSNDVTNALYFTYDDLAQGAMYLTANGASEQIVSSMSEGYEDAQDTSSSLADYLGSDQLYHPNSTAEGDYAFTQGLYNNEVYAYVGEDGELTFSLFHGINYTPGSWMYYDNFSVTKYALIATLGDSLSYTEASPANGDSVDVLSSITLTYDEEVTIAEGTTLYVIGEAGDTITTATLAAEGTSVTITLAEEITETGETYTITIPAATIGDATAGAANFVYGNANSEFTLSYIVPAVQVVLTLTGTVEQYVDATYATETYDFDSAAILAALGASSMDDVSFAILVDGEYDSSYTANYGFYFNTSVEKCSWGDDSCAFFAEYYGTGYDYIALGQYPGGCSEGDSYDVSFYFVYGYSAVEIALTYNIIETPAVEAEVVATIDVDVNLQEATVYSGDTAEFDVDAVCEALGITDITEAEQYIVNVTDSSYVTNTSDGWRNADGDMAGWDESSAGMVCVKINDPSTGLIDYIGCIDTSYSAGDTYTALWAFVYDGKAVIISVNITFVTEDVYVGISSISGQANGTFDATNIYSLSGQLIRTQATSLEGLQQGIYIVGGKKVLVK